MTGYLLDRPHLFIKDTVSLISNQNTIITPENLAAFPLHYQISSQVSLIFTVSF